MKYFIMHESDNYKEFQMTKEVNLMQEHLYLNSIKSLEQRADRVLNSQKSLYKWDRCKYI
jgi:hypothetical protein